MSTPEERRRIWREEQAAAERRRIWRQEQAAPQQPPTQEDLYTRLKRYASEGYDEGKAALVGAYDTVSEAASAARRRDFKPALEALELGARKGIGGQVALLTGGAASGLIPTITQSQAPAIARVNTEREARRLAGPDAPYYQGVAEERARREAIAASDPSRLGKVTRAVVSGGVQVLPTLAVGAVTGGSVPAIAATSAISALGTPENAPIAGMLGALPAPAVGKYIAPILRRVRVGRGAGAVASEVGGEVGNVAARAEARGIPRLEAMGAGPSSAIRSTGVAEQQASIRAASSRASMTTGPRAVESAALEVADPSLVTKAERSDIFEVISAARKAGLLSSVKTHIKNVVGTGGFQLSEEAARIPGALVDMLVSPITGRRTLTGPSLRAMERSFQEAATDGWKQSKEIWRRGISQADVERLGLNQEINSGMPLLDAYINKSFRLLSVEDKLMHTYAARRALESRAKAAALTEVRQGKIARGQVGPRSQELMKNADIQAGAIADAEMAVFTNENLASKFLGAGRKEIEKLPGGRTATFALDLVFPFVKTPTNVIARMLDYAGVGAAKETTKAIARRIVGKSMTEAQQRAFAAQWGRASVGSGLVTLGVIGYRNGWLTGFIEDDLGRRERDEAAGRTPGAIKIGSRWHQILGAAPLASLMVLGATLAREVDQEREGSGLLPVLETVGQSVGEQPLLIGTKQIGEALTKPGTTGERLVGGIAGSSSFHDGYSIHSRQAWMERKSRPDAN
jgi:hypothetical protein